MQIGSQFLKWTRNERNGDIVEINAMVKPQTIQNMYTLVCFGGSGVSPLVCLCAAVGGGCVKREAGPGIAGEGETETIKVYVPETIVDRCRNEWRKEGMSKNLEGVYPCGWGNVGKDGGSAKVRPSGCVSINQAPTADVASEKGDVGPVDEAG